MEDFIKDFLDHVNELKIGVVSAIKNMTKYDALPRCVWDFNAHFVYVNDLFAACFGYTPTEMNGKPFSDFILSDDLDKSMDEYVKNIDNQNVVVIDGFENRYRHKDGSIVNVKWIRGFNDFENKIGSGQIAINNINHE